MAQAKKVGWKCEDCGTELAVPHLTKRKPRKVVCSKCIKNYKDKK